MLSKVTAKNVGDVFRQTIVSGDLRLLCYLPRYRSSSRKQRLENSYSNRPMHGVML